jgi:hypothetical protein
MNSDRKSMRRTITCSLFAFLSFVLAFSAITSAQTGRGKPLPGELTERQRTAPNSMLNELSDIGLRFDCWFTIERTSTPTSRTLGVARFEIGSEVKTREALLETLKSQLKDGIIEVDANDPRVFHVIDSVLATDPDYVMDKSATLKFSGVLSELAGKIGEVVPGIDTRRGGSLREAFDDHVTRAEFEIKDKPVRSILTDAVPVDKYSPVLWIADTFEKDGKSVTWVQFAGKYDRKKGKQP